jgi:hypothetical protein
MQWQMTCFISMYPSISHHLVCVDQAGATIAIISDGSCTWLCDAKSSRTELEALIRNKMLLKVLNARIIVKGLGDGWGECHMCLYLNFCLNCVCVLCVDQSGDSE